MKQMNHKMAQSPSMNGQICVTSQITHVQAVLLQETPRAATVMPLYSSNVRVQSFVNFLYFNLFAAVGLVLFNNSNSNSNAIFVSRMTTEVVGNDFQLKLSISKVRQ